MGSLRSGSITPSVAQFFRGLERPLPPRQDGVLPTLLKVTNSAAKDINTEQLKKLNQPVHHFLCQDGSQRSGDDPCSAHSNERHALACKAFWDVCNAEPDIQFALGAQVFIAICGLSPRKVTFMQVMLIYNLDRSDVPSDIRLVNGSRGVVCELVNMETCQRELEEEERGRDVARAASSIAFDARGERANSSMSRSFVLKQYCDSLRAKAQDVKSLLFPRVQFINGVCKVITPCCFNQTLYDGGYVFRLQMPIKYQTLLCRHPPLAASDHAQAGLVFDSAQGSGRQHRFLRGRFGRLF